MQITVLDALTLGDVDWKPFEAFGTLSHYPTTSKKECFSRIEKSDIIITNKVILDKEALDHAKNLKLICITATGMNNVDLAYAKEKGIVVKNVAGYSTKSVAQTTFSMLFYLLQKLKTFDDFVKSGDYAKSPIFTHIEDFYEISGKKWGIIGMGEIGQEVAKIATAFGVEVLYYSTSGKNSDQPYKRVELDDLLRTSHIVSIHAPLNEKTHNLINEENLSLLQKDVVLINVGRGGIINEHDLAKALKKEHFYAALDVLTSEPMREDSPFYGIESNRLFITPHIAWTSREARESLMQGVYENIKEFMDAI